MKVNIGKQGWQKRDVIEGILEGLKYNNKTINDIRFIIKQEYHPKKDFKAGEKRYVEIRHWVTWAEFISPKVKIKRWDSLDWIIVGDNWWIDRDYEGQDEDTATWNFRTMPKRPKPLF